MGGWKLWAGGISGILAGLAIAIDGIVKNDPALVVKGVMAISVSLGGIGIGHKIEKAADQIAPRVPRLYQQNSDTTDINP